MQVETRVRGPSSCSLPQGQAALKVRVADPSATVHWWEVGSEPAQVSTFANYSRIQGAPHAGQEARKRGFFMLALPGCVLG